MIQRKNGMENFILIMGGIINIGGLHTVITGFYYKPTILVSMMLFLVLINDLSTLKCQKRIEIKLKVILWNILVDRIIFCQIHKLPLI